MSDENQAHEILDARANHTLLVPSRENLLTWFEDSKNPCSDDAFDSHGKFYKHCLTPFSLYGYIPILLKNCYTIDNGKFSDFVRW